MAPGQTFASGSSKSGKVLTKAGTALGAKADPLGPSFISNLGQWNPEAFFLSRLPGVNIWVTKTGVVYDYYEFHSARLSTPAAPGKFNAKDGTSTPAYVTGQVIGMEFAGASPNAYPTGVNQLPGKTTIINPGAKTYKVKSFGNTVIKNLYSGIDLKVTRDGETPRFDLIVAPGHDASNVRIQYRGADSLKDNGDGTLSIGTSLGVKQLTGLKAYQELPGVQRSVACSFRLMKDKMVGFRLGKHNPKLPVVIDPLIYSSLIGDDARTFGGNNLTQSFGVTVGADSEPVITGTTQSVEFPVSFGAYNKTVGNSSVFVSKFNADATALVYSTLINSGGTSMGLNVQQDASGRPVIAGFTNGGYPVTSNAVQKTIASGDKYADFLSILSSDGTSLDYSTLFAGGFDLGGTEPLFDLLDERADPRFYSIILNLQIDGANNIYLIGEGSITPSQNAYQSTNQGDGTYVASFNDSGSLLWDSYFTASGSLTYGAAVAQDGGIYFCGITGGNIPATKGAFDTEERGGSDGFITKFNPVTNNSPMTLAYSTYLGGSEDDECWRIAVDTVGDAYVYGDTDSVDFPTTPGAYSSGSAQGGANFLTKLAGDGASLLYSTYMSVSANITWLTVDPLGQAYITGCVNGDDPFQGVGTTADAYDTKFTEYNPKQVPPKPFPFYTPGDAFLQCYNATGTGLVYGTYFGGTYDDQGEMIVTDPGSNLYMTGWTDSFGTSSPASTEFPTTSPVFDDSYSCPAQNPAVTPPWLQPPDGFLSKFRAINAAYFTGISGPQVIAGSTPGTGSVSISTTSDSPVPVVVTSSNPSLIPSPGTIYVPVNATSANFNFTPSDVTVQTFVTLTGSHDGIFHSVGITVVPYLQSFKVAVGQIVGGNTSTARIFLSQNANSPVTLTINSSNQAAAEIVDASGNPLSTVTIPQGGSNILVAVKTFGVDVPTTVQFSARISSPSLAYVTTSTLLVLPASVSAVVLNPQTIYGGGSSQGTVQLNGAAGPSPIIVKLALTQGTAPVTLGATAITVASQATTAAFTVVSQEVTSNTFKTVQATESRDGSTASISVFVLPISTGSITLTSSSVVGGSSTTGYVTLNAPAPPSGFTLGVASSSPGYAAVPSTVNVAGGATQSNLFTVTTPVTTTKEIVTISAAGGGVSRSTTLTILPETVSLSLSPTSIEGGSGNVTGTVTLGQPESSGTLKIALTSTGSSSLTLNSSSVSLAAGNTVAHFLASTAVVNSSTTVTITASLQAKQGPITSSATVTLTPIPLVLNVVPSSLVGGVQNGAGMVTLGMPPKSGSVTVALSSSAQTAATVPASVTISAGSNSANFTVTTSLVTSSTNVTITGTVAGGSNTFVVTVLPPQVTLKSLTVADASDFGPFSTTATLTTTGTVPQPGVNVTLTSTNPGAVQVPNSVLLPAGATSVQFSVTANAVQADTPVTITASFGSSSVKANMDVLAQRSGTLTVTPAEITGGGTTTLVLQLNAPAPASGLPVTVTMSGPTGFPSITVGGQTLANGGSVTLTIPGGKYAADFTISTQAVSRQLGATLTGQFGAGGNQSSGTLILNPQT